MISFYTATNGKTIKTFKNPTSTRSRFPIFKYLSAFALVMMLGVNGVKGQSFTSTSVSTAWNASRWNNSSDASPYTSTFTANNAVSFTSGTYTFAGMGATVNVGNITVASGVTVNFSSAANTFATNGAVRTINVGSGGLFNLSSQTISTTSGTGFNKTGSGSFFTSGSAYNGGFTLSDGTIVLGGVNAMGAGALVLNGGTVAASGNRNITARYSSVTIGGNVQFGEIAANSALSDGTANITLADNISLGAATRTFTLGGSGTIAFGGIISNTGSNGLTFTANSNGTGRFDVTGNNTFSGPVSINGNGTGVAEVRFTADGSMGNSANDIIIDGGRFAKASDATTVTLVAGRDIQVGDGAGTGISSPGSGTLIYNNAITDKSGETGAWAKQGGGTLSLGGVSTYTGATTINNGTIQLTTGNDRLPTGTVLSLGQAASANLGTFDLNGRNQTIGGLNSTSGSNLTSSNNTITSATAATLTVNGAGSYGDGTNANSGIISGLISLVKSGSGTLTLGDANTYTGTTTVNGGTLALSGSGSIATSPTITVGSSGTFDVSGLTSALTLGVSQTLRGSATGSNTTGTIKVASSKNLTLSAGGLTFTALAATTTPPLTVDGTAGNLVLVSGCAITVPNNLSAGTYTLIAKSGSGATVSGTAGTLNYTGSSNGTTASVAITSGELILTVTSTLTPPTLTAAGSATVDAAFDVTFTDDATWRAAITSITVGGTTLTAGYSAAAGQITFTPSASAPASLLQSSGSKSIEVIATGYSNATVTQSIGVGAANKLTMNTQPAAPSSNGGALATQPKVNITDRYGNLTSSTAIITAAVGAGTWTLGGTTAVAAVSGTTTYSGLTATSAAAVTGATIDFTSAGLTGVTSSTFNIPAPLVSPTVTTPTSASIVNTTATLGGDVTSDGGAAITARGVVWSVDATNNNPTIGGGGVTNVVGTGTTGVFTVNAIGLPPNTLIAYRAYATNSVGTTYTTATTFTTLSVATKLVFGTAPAGTGNVGVNLTTFTVQAQRADNSVDAEYVANVAIARNIVSGSATLTGTTTVAAVAGTATFSAAQFNAVGTYTITASSASLTTTTSGSIVIDVAKITWANTTGSTAWYTPANWSPSTSSGAWLTTDIAQFQNTGTATTAGINIGTSPLSIGAIEISSARTRNLTIGSSSSNGTLTLNGATVNSIPNTILRNNSSSDLTITNNETGTGKTMGLVLANSTNNIINIDGAGGITITSVISGSGNLTKTGSGVLTLNASTSNTYTGKTVISAGTVSTSGESAFGANPGSFVADQITFNGGTLSASGSINFSSYRGITFTGSSNTINTNASTVTLTNIATGAGGYTKTGAGILVLAGAHTYTGATTLSAGTLQLAVGNVGSVGAITSSPIGTSTLNLNGGTLSSNGTTARTVLNATTIGGNITLGDALSNTGALTFDAATTISGATRTLTAASAVTFAGAIGDGGSGFGITKAGAGTLTLSGTNTYSGATTVNAGTLSISSIANGGSNSGIGASSNAAANLVLGGGTLQYTGGTASTDRNFTLSAATTSTIDNTNQLTISGASTATTGALTKAGSGTLILSGTNLYTGATTINAGTLSISSIANGGSGSGIGASTNAAANLVLGGGTLQYTGGTASTDRNFTLTAATTSTIDNTNQLTITGASTATTGALTKAGAGTLILGGSNVYTGATSINNGTIQLTTGNDRLPTGTVLSLGQAASTNLGTFDLNGQNQTIGGLNSTSGSNATSSNNTITSATAATLTVNGAGSYGDGTDANSGIIAGAVSLVKSGSGTLTLGDVNTYTGTTSINNGTIQLTSGNDRLPTSTVLSLGQAASANVGTLDLNGRNQTIAGLNSTTGTNATASNNTVTSASAATLTVTGAGSYGDGTNANSGIIAGAISLVKSSSGTLTLGDVNTYTGTTTVSGGTLQLAGVNAGSVGAITSSPIGTSTLNLNGGTLSSNSTTARTVLNATSIGGDITLGDATNTGALTFDAATTISGATRTLTAASAVAVAGAIGDGGSGFGITKAGAGTLTLSGANTYTGLTTVSGGTLQFNRTGGTTIPSTNDVSVSGGTLQISTNQTVNDLTLSGGTLQVDAGATLTINGAYTGGGTIVNNGKIVITATSAFPGSSTTISAMKDLEVNRSAGLSLDKNLSVTGTLTLTSGTLNIGSQTLTLSGGIARTSGTIDAATGTIVFANVVAQTLPSSLFSGNINNLTLDGSGGITLGNAPTLTGTLTLTSGILTTTATNLLTLDNGAAVSGVSNSSFVHGPVKKVGNTGFTFPVGSSGTGYQPIQIANFSGTTASTDAFTAEYKRSSAAGVGTNINSPVNRVSFCEYWQLDRTNGTPAVDVTLHFNANSGCGGGSSADYLVGRGGLLSELRVCRWDGTQWVNYTTANSGTAPNVTLTASAVSSFSPFTVGATGLAPLPLKLLSFKGIKKSNKIKLDWITTDEREMKEIEVYRSKDGENLDAIGQVASKGETYNRYAFIDSSTTTLNWYQLNQDVYYRLKFINLDKSYEWSDWINVPDSDELQVNHAILIYPNPASSSELHLQSRYPNNTMKEVRIYDMTGKLVYLKDIGGLSQYSIDLHGFNTGMYSVRILLNQGLIENYRLMVQF